MVSKAPGHSDHPKRYYSSSKLIMELIITSTTTFSNKSLVQVSVSQFRLRRFSEGGLNGPGNIRILDIWYSVINFV